MKTGVVDWIFPGLLAVAILFSPPALADRNVDQDDVPALVKEGKVRPLSELLALHPGRLAGHLLDAELEYEDDVLVYEIEVLGQDGVVREFYLDAATGTVLKEEIED